jgi:hypothetical protein
LSVTDYVIDILLILVIFRQARPHELTPRTALLPLALLVAAGAVYLRPFTLGGNDLLLIVILTVAGAALGAVSGAADRLWHDDRGRLLARAGAISVIAWVLGMGFRFWFAYYAYRSGGPAVGRFSVRHDITGAGIWTTALVLMAFGQVLGPAGRPATAPDPGRRLPGGVSADPDGRGWYPCLTADASWGARSPL